VAGKMVKFLYLSEEDMINAGVLDMEKCVHTIDSAFKLVGQGDYIAGGPSRKQHGIKIYFPTETPFPDMPVAGPDRRFMAMVSYLGGEFNVCAVKWYGSNIENPKRGLPRSILLIVLNDPNTAEPLAVMSANLVSAMRTGAVPGVAAKYLARRDSSVLGIVGCGVINRATLKGFVAALPNAQEVVVYDIFSNKATEYCNQMTDELKGKKLTFRVASSIEEAISNSDVISVATAGPQDPVIKTKWLKEGSLLALSATANLEEELLLSSKIVVDDWEMHLSQKVEENLYPNISDAEKLNLPVKYLFQLIDEGKITEKDINNLGPIAIGKTPGRTNDKERIVFMAGGMPAEDAAWSHAVYKEALSKGIGQELTLWNSPHWF
jgi:ornithine cyclodeaminase/alanine dehydrogenase-like protein (mu-crystallin family)